MEKRTIVPLCNGVHQGDVRKGFNRDEQLTAQRHNQDALRDFDAGVGDASLAFLQLWKGASEAEIYKFLALEIEPRINSHLARRTGLQAADREDCISEAFERFRAAVNARGTIDNPYAYVFTIAVNEALRLLKARRDEEIDADFDIEHLPDTDGDGFDFLDGGEPMDPAAPIARALVDDAVPELEVEDFWAVEVVRVAVAGLPNGARRILEFLQFRDFDFQEGANGDFDYISTNAKEDLGMKPEAFRTAKHRAYAKLREAIPKVIIDMGLQPPERAEAAIFPNGRSPEDDE